MMLKNWKTSSGLAVIALLAVAASWGGTFVVVKDAVSRMPVLDFLGVRFAVAALVMIALRPLCLKGLGKQGFKRAIWLGLALAMGYITQTFGLQHTSAAVSGFITGMFVVLTPLLSWLLLRHRAGPGTWAAVALATFGLGLISLRGWSIGSGELLTLLCAVFFALHIIGLGRWSASHNAYGLAVVQIGFVAGLCLGTGVVDGFMPPPDIGVWAAIGLTAILATAFAFLVQTWAQSLISPTRAALVITMEPVFAGLFAVMLAGEELTLRVLFGGLCVIAAMVLVELKPKPAVPRLEV